MIRPSACLRMRVVRWSRWNSSSRVSRSVCLRSIVSSRASWRCSSDWLRQARLRKTWLMPRRILAWPTAASTAVRWTEEKASATLAVSTIRPGLRGDVDVLALAEPRDHGRQPVLRQLERRPLQARQLAADPAAEAQHEEYREQDREQARACRQAEFQQQLVTDLGALGDQ